MYGYQSSHTVGRREQGHVDWVSDISAHAPKLEKSEKYLRVSSSLFFQSLFSPSSCFVLSETISKKDSILECRVGWGLFSCHLQGKAKIRTNEVK